MEGLRPSLDEYQRAAALRSALRIFLRRSEQIARGLGLTPQQYLVLLMIKGSPDGSERSTVTDLVERLQLTQSTVTELVARVEGPGLLCRSPSTEDGRVAWLSLTPAGEELLAAAFSGHGPERRRLARLLAELEPSDE